MHVRGIRVVQGVMIFLLAVAGGAMAADNAQECRIECSQRAIFQIVQLPSGNVPGARLTLYDAAGNFLAQGRSDEHGMISMQAVGAVEFRLTAPGYAERRVRLPQGLAELGGTLMLARPAGELVLKLPVNGGTGYLWQLAPGWGASLQHTEMTAGEPGRPGGQGEQRLTVSAPAPSEFLLLYARPWEAGKLPAAWRMVVLAPE